MENSHAGTPHRTVFVYVVEATFSSDGEVYGRECYRVAAEDEFEAERLGHFQALNRPTAMRAYSTLGWPSG